MFKRVVGGKVKAEGIDSTLQELGVRRDIRKKLENGNRSQVGVLRIGKRMTHWKDKGKETEERERLIM